MNPVSEQDLELLEEYLDGGLAPEDAGRLRTRLDDEPDLAAALDEVRAERATRAAVWASLEPTDRQADRFAERVIIAARRQDRQSRLWRVGRFGSAAAACLVLGVFMGWLGRDRQPAAASLTSWSPQQANVSIGPAVPVPTPAPSQSLGVVVNEIQINNPQGPPRHMLIVTDVTVAPDVAGTGLERGDLLLSIDGEQVHNVSTLAAALTRRRGPRNLGILRDNRLLELKVQFEQR